MGLKWPQSHSLWLNTQKNDSRKFQNKAKEKSKQKPQIYIVYLRTILYIALKISIWGWTRTAKIITHLFQQHSNRSAWGETHPKSTRHCCNISSMLDRKVMERSMNVCQIGFDFLFATISIDDSNNKQMWRAQLRPNKI